MHKLQNEYETLPNQMRHRYKLNSEIHNHNTRLKQNIYINHSKYKKINKIVDIAAACWNSFNNVDSNMTKTKLKQCIIQIFLQTYNM